VSAPADGFALVTGGSSGIGYELAKLLAQDRKNIVITARNEARLRQVQAEIERAHGVTVKVLAMDLSEPDAPSELLSELDAQSVHVDVLVNNAGFNVHGPFRDTELRRELEMIRLHVISLTHLTKLCLKGMLAKGTGRILNVSSIAAFAPGPLVSVHFASRAYTLHFTEALANELRGTGVTATCLCPGPTKSAFFERAGMEGVRLASGWPIRLLDAREVAKCGYSGMQRGKVVVVPGLQNKLLALVARAAPRGLVTKSVRWLMERV